MGVVAHALACLRVAEQRTDCRTVLFEIVRVVEEQSALAGHDLIDDPADRGADHWT